MQNWGTSTTREGSLVLHDLHLHLCCLELGRNGQLKTGVNGGQDTCRSDVEG